MKGGIIDGNVELTGVKREMIQVRMKAQECLRQVDGIMSTGTKTIYIVV